MSLDYVVRLSVDSGAKLERGPEVRTQTVRTRLSDGPARAVVEMHRSVGRVSATRRASRSADVWVTLPDVGTWTASAADGRFRFDRLPPGRHRLLARTADGREADAQIEVPGAGVDLVIGMTQRVGTDCPKGCLAASGRQSGGAERLGHG